MVFKKVNFINWLQYTTTTKESEQKHTTDLSHEDDGRARNQNHSPSSLPLPADHPTSRGTRNDVYVELSATAANVAPALASASQTAYTPSSTALQRPDPRDVNTGGPIGGGDAGEAIVGLHRPRPGPNGPASNLGGIRRWGAVLRHYWTRQNTTHLPEANREETTIRRRRGRSGPIVQRRQKRNVQDCCEKVIVSSAGSANQVQWDRMGLYIAQNERLHGRLVYNHEVTTSQYIKKYGIQDCDLLLELDPEPVLPLRRVRRLDARASARDQLWWNPE